jgi:hypothetical protein
VYWDTRTCRFTQRMRSFLLVQDCKYKSAASSCAHSTYYSNSRMCTQQFNNLASIELGNCACENQDFGIWSLISKSVLQSLECMFIYTDHRTEIVKLRLKYITSYGSWCIFIYDPLNGKWVQERWKVKSFCRVECFWWKLVVGNLLPSFLQEHFYWCFYLFYKSMLGFCFDTSKCIHMCGHLPNTQKDRAAQFSASSSVCLSVTQNFFRLIVSASTSNRNHVIAHNILKKQLSKLYNLYKFLYAKIFQDEKNLVTFLL